MKHRNVVTAVASCVLAACLAGAVLTVTQLDRFRYDTAFSDSLYIPSPQVVKRLSLGYGGLLADIYWTRVVQYFGGLHHEKSMSYTLLDPLLQITTTLDPKLTVAYEFGATFLAQKPPEGAGDPDAAIRLVRKGIQANPNQWRLYYNLGYILYIEKKDYKEAARVFEEGSHVPNAHPWLKIMAAIMAQHGGEIGVSRFLWEHIYQSAEDKSIKDNALNHLVALQVDEQVDYLNALIREYHQNTGKVPASWFEMISAGYMEKVPVDPTGKPYQLMSAGRVEVRDPDSLPFITKGLPAGAAPEIAPGVLQ